MGLYNAANGPWQLAVYTIDDAGNLTTKSTWQNMVNADIPYSEGVGLSFSPDSHYFAYSSFIAFEVFSWNSASGTATPIATINDAEGVCQTGPGWGGCKGNGFSKIAWDSNDDLYIGLGPQLFVYFGDGFWNRAGSGIAVYVSEPCVVGDGDQPGREVRFPSQAG